MVPREELIEQRLDGLEKTVDDGFKRVDGRFTQVDKKIDDGFAQVDKRFDKFDERFVSLERGLLWAAVAVIVTLIGCCATLVGVAVI